MRTLLIFVFAMACVASAQGSLPVPFVLDAGKPYVYIVFDHAEPRKPVERGESEQGVWLRLVNNCRVPVTVGAFDPGTDDPGTALIHDVVPLKLGGPHKSAKVPEGYSSEIYSLATVDPGEDLLFSVPANHLAREWYLRVRFRLEVSPEKVGDQPYSYVDFRWEQMPAGARVRR